VSLAEDKTGAVSRKLARTTKKGIEKVRKLAQVFRTMKRLSLIALAALLFVSCASREEIYRGIYDGLTESWFISSHQEMRDLSGQHPISYDLYKYERDRALAKDNEELKSAEIEQ
jgi:hypothetical protein